MAAFNFALTLRYKVFLRDRLGCSFAMHGVGILICEGEEDLYKERSGDQDATRKDVVEWVVERLMESCGILFHFDT